MCCPCPNFIVRMIEVSVVLYMYVHVVDLVNPTDFDCAISCSFKSFLHSVTPCFIDLDAPSASQPLKVFYEKKDEDTERNTSVPEAKPADSDQTVSAKEPGLHVCVMSKSIS